MIEITKHARQELKKILNDNVDHPQARLRLTSSGGEHLGLGVDIEMPDDQIVEHEGSCVLLVARELADRLAGIILDVQDTGDGPQLVIAEQAAES